MKTVIVERTEVGGRPDLDERFKGMARIPQARVWLRKVLAKAKRDGDASLATKTEKRMRQLGMKP